MLSILMGGDKCAVVLYCMIDIHVKYAFADTK